MSIKSDRWIRRMARDHGMIHPFAAEQVRGLDGKRIVSYGTSSYGYDVRCAPEFKIFTNINSTIVDPKAFDEKSFVDFGGDVCIIPPNSFALARTIEYFRIPRSVLTVCLGKCVTGDTRVVDADSGAYVPITAMRWGKSTLALERSRLRRAKVAALMPQGKRDVFELRTQAGLRIRATANHPFLMAQGWVPLQELAAGDRIAVARDIPIFGSTPLPDWEAVLVGLMLSQRASISCRNVPLFTTADAALAGLLGTAVRTSGLGSLGWDGGSCYRIIGHEHDGGAEENRAHRWLESHGLDVLAADKAIPQAIFTAPAPSVRRFLQALLSADGGVHQHAGSELDYGCNSRRLIEDVQHLLLRFAVFSVIREHAPAMGTPSWTLHIADSEQIERFASLIGFVPGSAPQQALTELLSSMRAGVERSSHVVAERAGSLLQSAATQALIGARQTGPPPVLSAPAHAAAPRVRGREANLPPLVSGPMWDVVAEILPSGREEVFDICVPALHNFVANGVIVHNSTYARCGIICNVTPLEPEWEGHVTLEFSNTTPLPAKIYANEGVAQMLFFEADEVCETSYKDRAGKYMGQRGVTLPKA